MKFFPLILYILIHLIITKKNQQDDSSLKRKEKDKYDELYYSRKMKRVIDKLGFSKNKLIDKEDFKKVFMNTIEKNLEDFNFHLPRKYQKEDNINNLLNQIYYKLVEKEIDELILEDAIKKYDPNRILKATDDIMSQLGYPNLVEEITNEVLEEENKDNNNNDKNNEDYNYDL